MGLRILLLLFLLLTAGRAARADYEETERRLKTAGIDEELRVRIHKAIDRGVEFLLSRQNAEGYWPRRVEISNHPRAGVAALCALALRHAGTSEAKSGFGPAMAYLFPENGPGRGEIHKDVYTAGIACMILMADRSRVAVGREIAREIARSYEPLSGWWGYQLATTEAPVPGKPVFPGQEWTRRNLSTTQFAGLGLWAGDRLGARIDQGVWRLHLESMIRFQLPDGSWPYDPFLMRDYAKKPPGRVAGRIVVEDFDLHLSYPTGTFMGLANLLLAKRALGESLDRCVALAAQARAAMWKGLDALDRDGAIALTELREQGHTGLDTYYTLYALEKACIFARVTEVGGVPWYRAGAEWLCDRQDQDGGWGGVEEPHSRGGILTGQEIDTAFSLLFLLRASESYAPTTPRPVDLRAVTPEPDQPAQERPSPLEDAPPPGVRVEVELSLAQGLLDRLRTAIEENVVDNETIVAALRHIDTACHGLVPDEGKPGDDAFAEAAIECRAEARRLALAAVALEKIDPASKENTRGPVNHLAARLLGAWGPEGSTGLIEVFERHVFRVKRYRIDAELYRSGFTSLAVMNRPEAFRWLFEEVVTAGWRPDAITRTRAALRALRAFEQVPGPLRLAGVKRLVKTLTPVFNPRSKRQAALSVVLRDEILATLRHIARDPATGRPPPLRVGDRPSFTGFRLWLDAHRNPDRPPWR